MSEPEVVTKPVSFEINSSLSFEKSKQAALLGHMLFNKTFFVEAIKVVSDDWFADPYHQRIFRAIQAIYSEFNRQPMPLEVKNWRAFGQEGGKVVERVAEAVDYAAKMCNHYGLDMLRKEITHWMHTIVFQKAVRKAADLHNAKKTDESWKTLESAIISRNTASFEEGINQGFASAESRILNERGERIAQSKKILQYGVLYLDHALGGIIPNDLILLGAKTGAGKTQLATSIALANSQVGRRVHYYALEAEDGEIERRIKYGMLSNHYYKNMGGKIPISYTDWRMGKIDGLMNPIEEKIQEELVSSVKNLNTFYRNTGSFDLKTLEATLMSIVSDTDLIVIDHLHYLDTDDENENAGYKKIIKSIRDIVLRFNKPIIVVAHLRKTQGGLRYQPLINSIEDFHGTSDVPKIATTCIMIAPATDHVAPKPYLLPTYMAAAKTRLDGSRTWFTGLTHFDATKSRYEAEYRIGRMKSFNQEWEELAGSTVPYWAHPKEPEVKSDHGM